MGVLHGFNDIISAKAAQLAVLSNLQQETKKNRELTADFNQLFFY